MTTMRPPVLPAAASHSVSTTHRGKYHLRVLPTLLCLHWPQTTSHLLHRVKGAVLGPLGYHTLTKHQSHPKRREETRLFQQASPAKLDYIHLFAPLSFLNTGTIMYRRAWKIGGTVGAHIDAISCPQCDLLTIQWRTTGLCLPSLPVRKPLVWDLRCPHAPTSLPSPQMST